MANIVTEKTGYISKENLMGVARAVSKTIIYKINLSKEGTNKCKPEIIRLISPAKSTILPIHDHI